MADEELRSIRFDPNARVRLGENSTTHVWYTDPTNKVCAGFWASEDFKGSVTYSEAEFCTLLTGEVRLTDQYGLTETYRAGDSFMIPAGFQGHWETVEPVRKFFMLYEAKGL